MLWFSASQRVETCSTRWERWISKSRGVGGRGVTGTAAQRWSRGSGFRGAGEWERGRAEAVVTDMGFSPDLGARNVFTRVGEIAQNGSGASTKFWLDRSHGDGKARRKAK